MKDKPLISAIVSTYNSEKFIRGKLEDLIAQTIFHKMEIIIINSGSQQNEDKIIKEYLHKYSNIKFIKTEERETIYKAWNRGIKISEGKYITNANTDDRLRNDAYEILSDYLEKNEDIALVYANQYITIVENQNFCEAIKNQSKICWFPNFDYIYLLERSIIGSQPMWRASLHFEDNIFFNEKYEICGDHELQLNISQYYNIKHLNLVLGTFYKSPQRTNKCEQNIELFKNEVLEITSYYTNIYLYRISLSQIKLLEKKFNKYIFYPIFFLKFLKKIEKLTYDNIYPKNFFHSIEFIYYFLICINLKFSNYKKVKKLCKRYLSYRFSKRIAEIFIKINDKYEK
ncbi:MAG: glycosyltransferase [Candidatus Lokiarchaeota archaeon]|nr:glycosyltransferase [Candidatus Lokiarchaeota archaeon]